jgi:RNA polymerase sigma-70 factor (ECF subfamily)
METPMHDVRRLSDLVMTRSAGLALYARQWVDRSTVDDVVQTALVSLLSLRREPEDPVAWMYRAVRNAAIDAARAQNRRSRREQSVASTQPDWFEPSPDSAMDAASAEVALAQLPADAREVVVLRVWGDLGFSAIAKVLGVSVSTAHARYTDALTQLRDALEQPCKTTISKRD